MSEDEWEEIEMKVVSTICLSFYPEVNYSVLNETAPHELWKKVYISKSLTNQLCLKKELS